MVQVVSSIEAGAHVHFDGDVHVTGPIGKGAKVVSLGSLVVDGRVGDGVTLCAGGDKPEGASSNIVTGRGNYVSASSSGSVSIGGSVTGCVIKTTYNDAAASKAALAHLTLNGPAGSNVTLYATGDVSVKGETGAGLSMSAGRNAQLGGFSAGGNAGIDGKALADKIIADVMNGLKGLKF